MPPGRTGSPRSMNSIKPPVSSMTSNRGKTRGVLASGGLTAAPDEVWQIGNVWLASNAEPVAEAVPECDAEFGCGAHQSEECVAAVASIGAARAATDLTLGYMETDVALGAVGVERYLWAIEHNQQLGLVGVQSREQAIERDEAGTSTEDAVEAGTQFAPAPRGGF